MAGNWASERAVMMAVMMAAKRDPPRAAMRVVYWGSSSAVY